MIRTHVAAAGAFAVVLLAACDASEKRLRTRAAFDLRCDASALKLVELGHRTRGVEGCGQRVTYVEQCGADGGDCIWVLNTDSRPTGWAPSANAFPAAPTQPFPAAPAQPFPAAPAQPAPAGI